MRAYDCPSCGATLNFASSIAISAVCSFCQSLVIRRDLDLEALGKIAQLPPDLSPLQIGTTGEFQKVSFRLIGRLRWQWSGGSWTEWFAECGDGHSAWLAETQGFFTFSRPVEADRLPAFDQLLAGQNPHIGDRAWTVVDIKESTCTGGEGQLPNGALPGLRERPANQPPALPRRSADLQGSDGAFATLESGDSGTEMFEGQYARYEELSFANLRPVPGWTPGFEGERKTGSVSFSCPNCGAIVNVRAAGLTMSAVCGSCASIISTSDTRYQILEKAGEKLRDYVPEIPIGTRGTFRGTEYEVIGYVRRGDDSSEWSEHLLFNPWHGFEWLVCSAGHWTFMGRLLASLERDPGSSNDGWRPFANYEAHVVAVLGEFYWQTSTSERTLVRDFVKPPYVISKEVYPDLAEITWSQGVYVQGQEVADAFKLEKIEPPSGVYLNQPNPSAEKRRQVRPFMWGAVLLLVLLQFFGTSSAKLRDAYSGQFVFRKADASRVMMSEPFDLPAGSGKVSITGRSNLNNAWLGIDLALVEEKTEKRYDSELGLEYYSGSDSDGSWSEGSREAEATLSEVPAGRYRLVMQAAADPNLNEMPFTVRLQRGGVFWSNFWLMLLGVVAYPIWLMSRAASFERRRWAESDLGSGSSAASNDDDD